MGAGLYSLLLYPTQPPTCRFILASDSEMRITASSWRTVMGMAGMSLPSALAARLLCGGGTGRGGAGQGRADEQAARAFDSPSLAQAVASFQPAWAVATPPRQASALPLSSRTTHLCP